MSDFKKIIPLAELLREDLEAICRDLDDELGAIAGKSVLITGAGGFLGYYLVQAIVHWNRTRMGRGGINLTAYDNYLRGYPEWLEALRGAPHVNIIRHDLTKPLPDDIGHFDYIVHAAGIASPIVYRKKPLECIDANIVGLRNLLDYAVRESAAGRPISGMLFFSSSEIYGDPAADAIPTPETYRGNVSCTGPRACYDESKRFGETLCVTFARQYGVPVRIARPFNNYGPGLKITDGRVLPDLARNVFAGQDLVLLSDGKPTRTFCYATDAVTGYYKILIRGQTSEAYNIGIDGAETSMAQLAELVRETSRELFAYGGRVVLGKSAEADYLVDNPNRRSPVIAKARAHLGFDPRVRVEEGVYRALVWYSHNRRGDAE